jgi:bifunctional UDP-N-acetylglucosamine pyrophosphorylase / glucosamine-1-phosphate N-acetyltransferase
VSVSGPAAVIILAAGEGTRMKARTPKVPHTVRGRTTLNHFVAAAREPEPGRLVVVVGRDRGQVAAHLAAIVERADASPGRSGTGGGAADETSTGGKSAAARREGRRKP